MKTVIVIPARMSSTRFPDKPMALIDGIPMVERVWMRAKEADIGSVYVGCCEKEVFDLISSVGGQPIMTDPNLPSGTDRIFEVVKNLTEIEEVDNIINLQGDMPIINPLDIKKVIIPLTQGFDMGTLVAKISLNEEIDNNITKAKISWIKKDNLGEALDFYKISKKYIENIYYHVGIYSFKFKSLKKFVDIKPSINEIKFNLEQLRALDNNMSIGASFIKSIPLSVDTKDDLIKVQNIIRDNV